MGGEVRVGVGGEGRVGVEEGSWMRHLPFLPSLPIYLSPTPLLVSPPSLPT